MLLVMMMLLQMTNRSTAVRIANTAISDETIQSVALDAAVTSTNSISSAIAGQTIQTIRIAIASSGWAAQLLRREIVVLTKTKKG